MKGSYRLPTHRQDAHRNFFSMLPSFLKMKILAIREQVFPLGSNGLRLNKIKKISLGILLTICLCTQKMLKKHHNSMEKNKVISS